MLNWLFKKKPAPATAPTPAPAPPPAAPTAAEAAARAAEAAGWSTRLDQARGNDDALLSLAREAPSVDIKLAAVEALQGEAALKAAEREFRTHDRRVFRAAKQRLGAAVARREAREGAQRLIESAEALHATDPIPANRLVALDRGWQALDATLVEPAQAARFAALREGLTALMHERAEREAAIARWQAAARLALARLQTVSLAVAQGVEERAHLAEAADAVEALVNTPPTAHHDPLLAGELNAARLVAAQIDARLSLLASFEAATTAGSDETPPVALSQALPPVQPAPALTEAPIEAATPAEATVPEPAAAALPSGPEASEAEVARDDNAHTGIDLDASPATEAPAAPAEEPGPGAPESPSEPAPQPAADAPMAVAAEPAHALTEAAVAPAGEPRSRVADPVDLSGPTSQWQALPPIDAQPVARALEQRWQAWLRAHAAPARPAAPAAPKRTERPPRVRPAAPDPQAVAQTEALIAQAETALADGHLAAAHQHLTALDAVALPSLRGRLQGLWAEHGRLKGWQQWGGARAREDLVEEAEALAAATLLPDAKVVPRQQAAAIDALRKRWKELDRLGGASAQPLWLRFDAALTTAHGPVAVELARVDAERRANLESREALLDTLAAALDLEPAPEIEAATVDADDTQGADVVVEPAASVAAQAASGAARLDVPVSDTADVTVDEEDRLGEVNDLSADAGQAPTYLSLRVRF